MPTFTKTVSYSDVDLTVNFFATKPVPARLYGPPEDCYPAEGGEIELDTIYLDEWEISSLLSPTVISHILSELEESLPELFEEDPYEPESDDDPFQGDRRPSGDWG